MAQRLATLGAIVLTVWGSCMQADPLPGSEWAPTELNGEVFKPIKDIFLRFESDGRFFGNAGCNTMRGQVVTNGDAILFGPAATTMMACPEEIAGQEFDVLQALSAARSFARDATDLSLFDAEGTPVLRLQQRDAD